MFLRLRSELHAPLSPGVLYRPSLPRPLLMLYLLSATSHLEHSGRLSPTKGAALLLDTLKGSLAVSTWEFRQGLGIDSQWSLSQGTLATSPSILLKSLSPFFFISLDGAIHHCLGIKPGLHKALPPQGRDERLAASALFLVSTVSSGVQQLRYIPNTLIK